MSEEDTFLSAVKSGDMAKVRRLIDQGGAKVNARDNSGSTPVFHANDVDIMQMLIANGAQVNLKDENGWTPLHRQIAYGGTAHKVACCELLLSTNADIEATALGGSTPLHFATVNSHATQVVELLLAHQRSRHGAAGVGSLLLKTRTQTGHNALHRCAMYHYATSETARVLVEQCRGKDGILLAACHQIMIAKAKGLNGHTPLDFAKLLSKSEVVEYLEPFTTLPLAASPNDCGLAVMLNPKLDNFQRAMATDCFDLIRSCCDDVPDAAVYILLGYLSSFDVMKR